VRCSRAGLRAQLTAAAAPPAAQSVGQVCAEGLASGRYVTMEHGIHSDEQVTQMCATARQLDCASQSAYPPTPALTAPHLTRHHGRGRHDPPLCRLLRQRQHRRDNPEVHGHGLLWSGPAERGDRRGPRRDPRRYLAAPQRDTPARWSRHASPFDPSVASAMALTSTLAMDLPCLEPPWHWGLKI
jgi:hypothetical protein